MSSSGIGHGSLTQRAPKVMMPGRRQWLWSRKKKCESKTLRKEKMPVTGGVWEPERLEPKMTLVSIIKMHCEALEISQEFFTELIRSLARGVNRALS